MGVVTGVVTGARVYIPDRGPPIVLYEVLVLLTQALQQLAVFLVDLLVMQGQVAPAPPGQLAGIVQLQHNA